MITSNYGPDCRAGMCPLYPLHLALLYLCLALPLLVAVVDGSLATWQLAFSRNQVSWAVQTLLSFRVYARYLFLIRILIWGHFDTYPY